ncbi:beta-galactosidase [candidate division KSB1 bacterium]|nr:MAG: beta-galactosidase [candidate division KSB1 bacterium]
MRKTINLDGVWQYKLDAENQGREKRYYDLREASDWMDMDIPQNWQLAGVEDYSGVIWFRRQFRLSCSSDYDVWLQFKGVDYFAEVWVNGYYVGRHEGYFQTFEFNITEYLSDSRENMLVVRVESPSEDPETVWPARKRLIKGIFGHHDCRPGSGTKLGQMKNTGGIWNSVKIELRRRIFVQKAKVSAKLIEGSARVKTECKIVNFESERHELQIELKITAPDQQVFKTLFQKEIFPGDNLVIFVKNIDHPQLWWPWDLGEQPLYQAEVTLLSSAEIIDYISFSFGIREIKIDKDKTWWLNGEKIFIRGTNIIPTQWLSEYNMEMIHKDIQLLKDANINAVRVHAHVNRQEFYEACDRAGIIVWQDFALQWHYEDSEEFAANAIVQIKEMVNLLHNHPSILVWCCHNEPGRQEITLDPLLKDAILMEDDYRVVWMNSNLDEHAYPGWYHGHYRDFIALPSKPLITEFGAQALPNVNSLRRMFNEHELWPIDWEKWEFHDFQYEPTFQLAQIEMGENIETFVENSQSYQAKLLKFAIETYRCAKFTEVTGLFQYMFVESWPSITWAVVDYFRQPKKAYWILQQVYQPLYLVVRRNKPIERQGGKIEGSFILINDYLQEFPQAIIKLTLVDERGEKQMEWNSIECDIKKNDVMDISDLIREKTDGMKLPVDITPGKYILKNCIIDKKNKILSTNEEIVEITAAPLGQCH